MAPVESKAKVAGATGWDPTGIMVGSNADNHAKVCCLRLSA